MSVLAKLKHGIALRLRKTKIGRHTTMPHVHVAQSTQAPTHQNPQPAEQWLAPAKATLPDAVRTQWQYGSWDKLSQGQHHDLSTEDIRTQALYWAVAHMQNGRPEEARAALKLAKQHGATEKQMATLLVSSVYNNLGNIALLQGDAESAKAHYKESVHISQPEGDAEIAAEVRYLGQVKHLQTLSQQKTKALALGSTAQTEPQAQPLLGNNDAERLPMCMASCLVQQVPIQVFIDIGSGSGRYPIYLKAQHPGIDVFAFEDHQPSFKRMMQHMQHAGLYIKTYDLALSTGKHKLDDVFQSRMRANHFLRIQAASPGELQTILRGAENLLAAHIAVLQIKPPLLSAGAAKLPSNIQTWLAQHFFAPMGTLGGYLYYSNMAVADNNAAWGPALRMANAMQNTHKPPDNNTAENSGPAPFDMTTDHHAQIWTH